MAESDREAVSLYNLWRFMGFSLPYWPSLLGGLVSGLLRMVLPLIMPLFLQRAIDNVAVPYTQGEIDAGTVWARMSAMAGLLALILVMHAGVTLGRQYFAYRAAASAIRDIRFRLFRHLQRLSLGFHQQRATGGIVSRVIADVQSAQQAFDLILIRLSQQVVQAVVITATLLWTDWVWASVAFATMPLFVVTTTLVRGPMRRATRQQRETVERMSGFVQERFSMIREVQSFTAEPHEERQVLGEAENLRRHTVRQQVWNGTLMAATEITRYLGLAIVLGFGVYRITHGQAKIGALALFYRYTEQALAPLQFFATLYAQLQAAAAAADRVFHFFDTEPDIQERGDERTLALEGPPDVRFEHVSFRYPTDEPAVVLEDVDFETRAGSLCVLVGESGSGKSTLMSLLPRFYDVQGGRVLVDGTDIREFTVRSLRAAIAVVPQEPVLFTGTVRENIGYGRRKATREQIEAAARAANADAFVRELEDGYETEVGERGVGLSGGQIQRIAIARAFLKDPQVLIMDEPTSALDATSESLVLDALSRLAEGRTTFLIAHRLSVARNADQIVVLERGRVSEIGTHDELLRREGAYATLWRAQTGEAGE